jgi:hypothetical protein
MRKHLDKPAREWSSDTSLAVMLGSLIILIFVALPLEAANQYSFAARMLSVSCFTVLGLAIAAALGNTRRERLLGTLAALIPAGLAWVQLFQPDAGLGTPRSALALLFMVLYSGLALRLVLRPGPVTNRQIAGAVAVYLLAALGFGEAYWLLAHVNPQAIGFADAPAGHEALRADFVYFSIATITTVGFGDVVPVSTAARVLVSMEALFGQLYLVILLSRLVSNQQPVHTP